MSQRSDYSVRSRARPDGRVQTGLAWPEKWSCLGTTGGPERALKVRCRPADASAMRTAMRTDPLLSLLLDAEDELSPAWCARFEVGSYVPFTAREVLHQVLLAIASESSPAALAEASYALGVLRAQQGRDPMSIVEDVLALRPHLWRHVAARPELLGDSTQLLVIQQ